MQTLRAPEIAPPLPKRPPADHEIQIRGEGLRYAENERIGKELQTIDDGYETKLSDQAYELTLDDINLDAKDDEYLDGDSTSPADLKASQTEPVDSSITSEPSHSKWKTAYSATKHFAGGLISHPVVSTKHYSVLRHSHGLVFYKGMSTNVAITIFADDVLPPERTIWMQQKGWSGNRGMRFKAVTGRTGDWIDVTPQARVAPEQVNASDEKAWQRDIGKFLGKAAEDKKFKRRRPVETCIIRVPYASQDGYFRLMVCADGGKKLLCASPVFRVASLSTSSASFKGASLSTMPLEIGIKALTTFALDMASSGMGPVVNAVHNRFGKFVPGFVTQQVATKAYSATGLQNKVGAVNQHYEQARANEYGELTGDERPVVVGDDNGPEEPYPVRFSGKIARGAGLSNIETGLPTANLRGVREELKSRLNGVYFGWVAITQSQTIVSDEWRQALIFAQPPNDAPKVTPKKTIRAYIIEDFEGVEFFGAKLIAIVMGYLRPWTPYDPTSFVRETYVDIMIAQQSLDREHWGPAQTLQRVATNTSLTDRYVNARQFGQRHIDRIPFDKLAIRRSNVELKDGVMGKGGLFIDRMAQPTHAATAPP